MAQHHGLPTRLLDWTSNPLVALYFAAIDESSSAATVYYFRRRRNAGADINVYTDSFSPKSKHHPHVPNPLKVDGVRIVYPMTSTDRIVAQRGAFTIQDPYTPLDEQANGGDLDTASSIHSMFARTMPSWAKRHILSQLERLGISPRTLFPDLGGLGKGLLHTEQLRPDPVSYT